MWNQVRAFERGAVVGRTSCGVRGAGCGVPGFTDKTVTNDTPGDSTVPTLSSAAVNGTTLTLTFDEALDGNSVPAQALFTVTAGGGEVDLADTNPVAVDGTTVTLKLATPVLYDQAVTVGYDGVEAHNDACEGQQQTLGSEPPGALP